MDSITGKEKNNVELSKLFVIISVMLPLTMCSCSIYERNIELTQFESDHYFETAREIITREFPHVDLEDDYSHYIFKDKAIIHIIFERDSDRDTFAGMNSYCHENFMREKATVVLRPSGEMAAVSIEKRYIPAECVN